MVEASAGGGQVGRADRILRDKLEMLVKTALLICADKANASSSNGETMATVQSEITLKTLEQYRHSPTTYLTRLA